MLQFCEHNRVKQNSTDYKGEWLLPYSTPGLAEWRIPWGLNLNKTVVHSLLTYHTFWHTRKIWTKALWMIDPWQTTVLGLFWVKPECEEKSECLDTSIGLSILIKRRLSPYYKTTARDAQNIGYYAHRHSWWKGKTDIKCLASCELGVNWPPVSNGPYIFPLVRKLDPLVKRLRGDIQSWGFTLARANQ